MGKIFFEAEGDLDTWIRKYAVDEYGSKRGSLGKAMNDAIRHMRNTT